MLGDLGDIFVFPKCQVTQTELTSASAPRKGPGQERDKRNKSVHQKDHPGEPEELLQVVEVESAFFDKSFSSEDKDESKNYAEEQRAAQHHTQKVVHLKKLS